MKSSSALVLAVLAVNGTCQSLPTVDLGYEVHQALSYNVRFKVPSRVLSHCHDRIPTEPTASTISDLRSHPSATCASPHQYHQLGETQTFRMAALVQSVHRPVQAGLLLAQPSPRLLLKAMRRASTTLRQWPLHKLLRLQLHHICQVLRKPKIVYS